jgi:hypothetical protein
MAHTWYIITGIMTARDSKELINQSYYNRNKGDEGLMGWSETDEADMSCTKYVTDSSEWDILKKLMLVQVVANSRSQIQICKECTEKCPHLRRI